MIIKAAYQALTMLYFFHPYTSSFTLIYTIRETVSRLSHLEECHNVIYDINYIAKSIVSPPFN